jgi:CheY-like chemotaxis protein
MLGGEIQVASQPGAGSTFSFTLPLMSTDLPGPVPDLLTAQLAQASARRPKILVVEDDRDLAMLLRRQLESDGYQVVLAGSGEDALWLAREAKPQLITLDVMLPDIDGFAVLQRLKQSPLTSGIPVVIVSVLTETEKGYAMGAVDYVVKPFEEDQLLGVVKDAFRDLEKERPERLVVADDDAEALSLMERTLGLHGYQVWTAPNGEEALSQVTECEPDLILLDTEMPVVDGYEVVRRLQADASTRNIPVILITGRPIDRERDRVEVLGTRVARFVSKPLSMEILIREIKKVIAAEPQG